MNANQFLPADDLITQMVQTVGDESFRRPRSFYVDVLQNAMKYMSIETLSDVRVYQFVMPQNLTVKLPKDFFDLTQLWLYTGDQCTKQTSVNVYRHANFRSRGDGYLANNKGENNFPDPFYKNAFYLEPTNLYTWEIQNGLLMFNDNCRSWPKGHMEYRGIGFDFGKELTIPILLSDAVFDNAMVRLCTIMMRSDPKTFSLLLREFKDRAKNSEAQARVNTSVLDQKAREDLVEAMSRFGPVQY